MKKCIIFVMALVLAGGCAANAYDRESELRLKLFQEAMEYVGVCGRDEAANVWAKGLMERSAAMQYSVMDSPLKKQYAKSLQKSAPNWVTGVSSPWVSGYRVFDINETDDGLFLYSLTVYTESSAGPEGEYTAVLAIGRDGDFWRIKGIFTDEELFAYTGFY
ncbi:MAG: hypothetical protein WDA65_06745 [Christensenellales bacterium]